MPIDEGEIAWVSSAGGPLILIAPNDILSWGGVIPPNEDHPIKAKFRWAGANSPATDYDRACDIEAVLGLVEVGEGQGLVLSEGVLPAGWWKNSSGSGMLVQGGYNDDEAFILSEISSVPTDLWKVVVSEFSVVTSPLYLFDAAIPGVDVESSGEYLALPLSPDNYSVAYAQYNIVGNYVVLFRFDKHE